MHGAVFIDLDLMHKKLKKVKVKVSAVGCSYISINSAWNFLFRFDQRCGKDLLIGGGAQFLTKSICSIGHIEWAWHRLKACWGGGAHAPGAPLVLPWFLCLWM